MRGNPTVNKVVAHTTTDNGMAIEDRGSVSWTGLTAKSLVLLGIVIISALISANYIVTALLDGQDITGALIWGTVLPFIPMLIISFIIFRMPKASMALSIIYSICSGIMLGMVSGIIDLFYPGVALTAILGTMVVFAVTIVTHRLLGARLSNKFRRFFFIALISFVILQFGVIIVSLFSSSVASLWSSFGVQMACSAVCILLATFSLLIDIDNMTRMVEGGADKSYEWMAAFSLITTLVWLYIEILELLARLAQRNN